ncbi:MAG: hypothetical protein MUC97_00405 [Bernardetiaceae bacterium]|jgi:hypothetical protein|nr:hypothetical protein [Bernardetiaceae bacterium]
MAVKKVIFVLPDGVGVRNYLHTRVLDEVAARAQILIWSPLPQAVFDGIGQARNLPLAYQSMRLPPEPLLVRLLREACTFARLRYNARTANNPTIMLNWDYHPARLGKRVLLGLAQWLGTCGLRSYRAILRCERLAQWLWPATSVATFKKKLATAQATSVFITHQRAVGLVPLCLAAQALGIKVYSVIFSWDNLPKARLNVLCDEYLVWSDYMKAEMALYYPHVPPERVKITGTPQFEFYHEPGRVQPRAVFAQAHGLDPAAKWILYSGGDVRTSPHDPQYLAHLAAAVRLNPALRIILRKSPADASARFAQVLARYADVVTAIDPEWDFNASDWAANVPRASDLDLLANLVAHCELAVNVGSTIAHDFAQLDKPCIYINYNAVADPAWRIEDLNAFQHFRSMNQLDAVVWVNQAADWPAVLERAIAQPWVCAKDRVRWLQVVNQAGPSSQIIAQTITQ